MIVNSSALQAAGRSFRALFKEQQAALGKIAVLYTMLAMLVPSTAISEDYAWLGELPQMREWLGDRVVHGLKAHGYSIRKKDWELTIGVARDDIQFDRLGLVTPRIKELARQGEVHYDQMVFALLASGFETPCYDDQYFFDTDHPVEVRPGVLESKSNKGTAVLSATSYGTAYDAMLSQTGEMGKPLGVMPTHLVVAPQNRSMGKTILEADRIGDATNIHKGSATLIVAPWLAAHPTKWFLMDLSREIKPVILQVVKAPEFVALDRPDDENAFKRKEFLYGIDGQDNVGFGLWQLAWGSTGAGEG